MMQYEDDDDDSLANPSWDDEDPDEPGYVVHRLSTTQLQDVERAIRDNDQSCPNRTQKGD